MSEEKSNPIAGVYGVGIIGFTALGYSVDGFWLAFFKSLIWPIYLVVYLVDKLS